VLVLARREGEEIIVADVIRIRVLSVTGKIVRLGFDAPDGVRIERQETIAVTIDKEAKRD